MAKTLSRGVRPRHGAQGAPAPSTTDSSSTRTRPEARELLAWLSRQSAARARELAPHLSRVLALAARVPQVLLGVLVRHRLLAFRVSHRVMWWAALAVLLVAGRALLGGQETAAWVDRVHVHFTVGLALCALVLVFAAERRLRVAAFVLATGHGTFALLAWLVSQP